jgi:superfamily II DNA or RNA helicase
MPDFTPSDREMCIKALTARLQTADLRELVPHELRHAVAAVQNYKLFTGERLAALLVDLHGPELLRERAVRAALLKRASIARLRLLCDYDETPMPARRRKTEELIASRVWHPGKGWPRCFIQSLGLPSIMAGSFDGGEEPPILEIVPPRQLPELHDFQRELHDAVLEVLYGAAGANRAILSLPTGAGKTRTVVEAAATGLKNGLLNGDKRFLLWIAQSDELCEQAVGAFREVWMNRAWSAQQHPGGLPPLRVFRLWGGRASPDALEDGVVVASIQKLAAVVKHDEGVWKPFFEAVRAVIVDEAHHAIAPSYTGVFKKLGIEQSKKKSRTPLLGLTATPGRGSDEQSHQLAAKFYHRLLAPRWKDPIETLRKREILAVAHTQQLKTQRRYILSDKEREQVEQFGDVPSSALARIGNDAQRNKHLLEEMLAVPEGRPVLFFGCSVMHAQAMALLLKRAERRAEVVTGTTPRSMRRERIEAFRRGEIQFLCNYGVLTTGFDAPQVEVVVVARPTGSALLYEQMIGRGMRGPVNGGTKECLIIDTIDLIEGFGESMSYTRYLKLWTRRDTAARKAAAHRPRAAAGSRS